MLIELQTCCVRSYRESDADSLAEHANNRKVWLNLRDAFPHPYSLENADDFIERAVNADPETNFAISLSSESPAVGGIGFSLHTDVERVSAEIGYWLGEPVWGRGIATEALRALTAYAVETHGLSRVFAVPYAANAASARVLEKAGYRCEARMRRSVIKNGEIQDQFLYAFVVMR